MSRGSRASHQGGPLKATFITNGSAITCSPQTAVGPMTRPGLGNPTQEKQHRNAPLRKQRRPFRTRPGQHRKQNGTRSDIAEIGGGPSDLASPAMPPMRICPRSSLTRSRMCPNYCSTYSHCLPLGPTILATLASPSAAASFSVNTSVVHMSPSAVPTPVSGSVARTFLEASLGTLGQSRCETHQCENRARIAARWDRAPCP